MVFFVILSILKSGLKIEQNYYYVIPAGAAELAGLAVVGGLFGPNGFGLATSGAAAAGAST